MWKPSNPGSPRRMAVKPVCVSVFVCKARFPFKCNRLRCVRCVNENRKKHKRLRWQAANHGCHCFDRAFLLAGACVCCVNASDCVWMETGLKVVHFTVRCVAKTNDRIAFTCIFVSVSAYALNQCCPTFGSRAACDCRRRPMRPSAAGKF